MQDVSVEMCTKNMGISRTELHVKETETMYAAMGESRTFWELGQAGMCWDKLPRSTLAHVLPCGNQQGLHITLITCM